MENTYSGAGEQVYACKARKQASRIHLAPKPSEEVVNSQLRDIVPVHGCKSLLGSNIFSQRSSQKECMESTVTVHGFAASLCALATDLVNGRGAITTGRRTRGVGRAAAAAEAGAAVAIAAKVGTCA